MNSQQSTRGLQVFDPSAEEVKSASVPRWSQPARRIGSALLALSFCFLSQLPSAQAADVPLRIMASNLTSGSSQKYEAAGTRILQGLDPDIVMMQEFNYGGNSSTELRAFVDTAFGSSFSYWREPTGNIPNGIISRYPIKAAGEWDDTLVSDRDFVWAQIDIPGDKDLWVVSVHLLSSSSTSRNSEAKALVNYIKAKGIPSTDYLVIGGDLNTTSRGESCVSALSAVVNTSSPYPADQKSNSNTNSNRNYPYDWVLPNTNLKAAQIPVYVGASTYTNGLVFDSRVYTPLSEVYPVQYSDSGASGMQHMGVVKDFLIPGGTTTTPPPVSTDASSVMISEIMYSPSSGPEWIELYNSSTQAVDLSGLYLTDNEGIDLNEGEFYFPSGTTIAAGGYLVIGATAGTGINLAWNSTTFALANLGDDVYLAYDAAKDGLFVTADVIDGVTYSSTWGGTGGYSLSRSTASKSSGWKSSTTVGGTPGAKNDGW